MCANSVIHNLVILTFCFLLCQSFVYNIYVLNLFDTQCRYNHTLQYFINKIIILKVQNIFLHIKILIKRKFIYLLLCLRNKTLQNWFRAYTFFGKKWSCISNIKVKVQTTCRKKRRKKNRK